MPHPTPATPRSPAQLHTGRGSEASSPTPDGGLPGLSRSAWKKRVRLTQFCNWGILRPKLPELPLVLSHPGPTPVRSRLGQLNSFSCTADGAWRSRRRSPGSRHQTCSVGRLSCLLWLLRLPGGAWGWTGLEVGAPTPPELVLLEEFRGRVVSGKPAGAGCRLESGGLAPWQDRPPAPGGLASKGRFELFLAHDSVLLKHRV